MVRFERQLLVSVVRAFLMLPAVMNQQKFTYGQVLMRFSMLQVMFHQQGQAQQLPEFSSGKGKNQEEQYVNTLLQQCEVRGFIIRVSSPPLRHLLS